MKYLCIYHKNCSDGFGAALAVKQYCDLNNFDCEFIAAQHGDEAPDVSNKHVFIVDFSYSREVILKLEKEADSLLVIDHHKTAEEALAGLDCTVFDMERSGAVLTWEHLLPERPLPTLLAYIQDRDLWHWQLPNSKEVSAALQTCAMTFDVWEQYLDETKLLDLISKGEAIVEYQNKQISRATKPKNIEMVDIAGYQVPCVNTNSLASEIGNDLAKGQPFAAMYCDNADKRIFSLRSDVDGVDVANIAKLFGGGGHFHAAGFAVEKPKISLSLKTTSVTK